jgi:bifunctional UDP-N-acetylglucosamine pyrophosphorylase/glucosamine-1-phosphate N-acetyltransferase
VVEQKAGRPSSSPSAKSTWGSLLAQRPLLEARDEIEPNNPANEYYLTDMVEILSRAGHPVEAMQLDDPREVIGINNRVELAEIDAIFRQRKVRDLMVEGVTIEKPETVTIDSGVRIGIDTVVEPFAQILGRSAIGENCRIGSCSIVRDSEIGDDVEVGPFTIINRSRMKFGSDCLLE